VKLVQVEITSVQPPQAGVQRDADVFVIQRLLRVDAAVIAAL